MASDMSRLRVTDQAGITRISFIDRNILDEANIQAIGEEISSLIELAPVPRILISFKDVDHLSSAALGTLIKLNQGIQARGGQLRLADIDPQIYEVFQITRLNRLFDIHPTSDEAVKSFTV